MREKCPKCGSTMVKYVILTLHKDECKCENCGYQGAIKEFSQGENNDKAGSERTET